jgi:hypothetical protein
MHACTITLKFEDMVKIAYQEIEGTRNENQFTA